VGTLHRFGQQRQHVKHRAQCSDAVGSVGALIDYLEQIERRLVVVQHAPAHGTLPVAVTDFHLQQQLEGDLVVLCVDLEPERLLPLLCDA
jgi:hypothetical protein